MAIYNKKIPFLIYHTAISVECILLEEEGFTVIVTVESSQSMVVPVSTLHWLHDNILYSIKSQHVL